MAKRPILRNISRESEGTEGLTADSYVKIYPRVESALSL